MNTTHANSLFAACTAYQTNMTVTENGDLTNVSSQDALVDFFFSVIDTSTDDVVRQYLTSAWKANANDALKLVFYLFDVREGKACTKQALSAFLWLYECHPQTLLANIEHFTTFGCVRDLPTLLMMIRCKHASGINYDEWRTKKVREIQRTFDHDAFYKRIRNATLPSAAKELHVAIVKLFVDALVQDKYHLNKSKPISLFSKWLPSQDSYLNRTTALFDDVAIQIYKIDHANNVQRRPLLHARNHLRKAYISPLRKYAQIVERLMSEKKWKEINYTKVPSVCMTRNAMNFKEHDEVRYLAYLKGAASGETKINVSALKPHEICFPSIKQAKSLPPDLANAQWEAYVTRMQMSGVLNNAVAVCDVSGSMRGQPMQVAISLGLLVASLAQAPWKDHLITFSADPEFHFVQGSCLAEKLRDIANMDWGCNTNFDRVFDLILATAKRNSLKEDEMPKTLFVFSDMQFDQADSSMTTTAFERIKKKYADAGYEMPQMVFWNLLFASGVPVTVTDEGTALIGGFSGNLLKIFLEGANFEEEWEMVEDKPKMTPIDTMRKAIDHERFNVLCVVD